MRPESNHLCNFKKGNLKPDVSYQGATVPVNRKITISIRNKYVKYINTSDRSSWHPVD